MLQIRENSMAISLFHLNIETNKKSDKFPDARSCVQRKCDEIGHFGLLFLFIYVEYCWVHEKRDEYSAFHRRVTRFTSKSNGSSKSHYVSKSFSRGSDWSRRLKRNRGIFYYDVERFPSSVSLWLLLIFISILFQPQVHYPHPRCHHRHCAIIMTNEVRGSMTNKDSAIRENNELHFAQISW